MVDSFNINYILECLLKLFFAAGCGFCMGYERRTKKNQVIGIKTLVLICVSTSLLSILSHYMAANELAEQIGRGDPTRIASGVINGIGFVGAGAILKQGLNIKGITSAAIIWTAASIGLSIGAGLYVQTGFAMIIVMGILIIFEKFEHRIFPASTIKMLHLCYENDDLDIQTVEKVISDFGFVVIDLNLSNVITTKQMILHISAKIIHDCDYMQLKNNLQKIGMLTEFSVTD